MRLTTTLLLAFASISTVQCSIAAAATPSPSIAPSGCGHAVDLIIQACLSSTTGPLDACVANDWKCMCTQVTNVVTCFNNCPSDPDAYGWQQKKTSYCNAAKTFPGSSSAAPNGGGKTAAGAGVTVSSSKAATGAHTGFATGSGSASASAQATGNIAADLTPAGGLLAAALGLVLL